MARPGIEPRISDLRAGALSTALRGPALMNSKNPAKIGDMTYVREVTQTDFYNCMCLYFQFDLICVFSEFVSTSKSFF